MSMVSFRPEKSEPEKTLVSWKEIASFLDRAERTVKRWERERGLPVHRIPGGERGGVYAYPAELRSWLLREEGKQAQSSTETESDSIAEEPVPSAEPAGARAVVPVLVKSSYEPANDNRARASARRWVAWIAPPVLLAGIIGMVLLTSRFNRSTMAARGADSAKTATHIPSPRAEELYLQGRYEWSLRTADSLNKSIDAYTQAIVQDPAYALAYAGLAESYDLLPEYGGKDRGEAFSRAKAAADRANALDPNLSAGHRAKAFAMFYGDWDAPGSDAEFKEALTLAPNEVETRHWYATTLYSRREKHEALTQIDEALRLSPTNPAIQADAAFLHVSLGDNVESNIKTLRELAQTQPNLVKASRYLYGIDFEHRDYEAYLADLRQSVSIAHGAGESELYAAVERGWARGGEHGFLIAMRDVFLAQYARGENTPFDIAGVCLRLGQPRAAVRYFKLALEKRDVRISWLAGGANPDLEKDPDYRMLVTQINASLHLHSSPSLHLAVATRPGQISTPEPGHP